MEPAIASPLGLWQDPPHLHPLPAVTSINDNSWLYWSHVTTAGGLTNGSCVVDKYKDRIESLGKHKLQFAWGRFGPVQIQILIYDIFFLPQATLLLLCKANRNNYLYMFP